LTARKLRESIEAIFRSWAAIWTGSLIIDCRKQLLPVRRSLAHAPADDVNPEAACRLLLAELVKVGEGAPYVRLLRRPNPSGRRRGSQRPGRPP
jgi:hypothetical protein